jgi:NADPH-dependent ferric siderophore reductase
LRRIALTGRALENFPPGKESAHVKIAVPVEGDRVARRSYTVRRFDARHQRLVIDMVDHGDKGPGSRWARQARPGDRVCVYGPGEPKLADPGADWFLFAGDMTALPALSVNLERLAAGARGYAVIEVSDVRDCHDLTVPRGFGVTWVVRRPGQPPNEALVKAVRALPWLRGTPYPWFAGEFEGMRQLRAYLRDERGVDRRAMYLSCYWKLGASSEAMKRAKRLDAERDGLPDRFIGAPGARAGAIAAR